MSRSYVENVSMKSWKEKVFSADDIWSKVERALEEYGMEMPQTPRRPDIRGVVNNTSKQTARFLNPGDHSASKEEEIPADGENTAVMIMFKGESLEEQYRNANSLFEKYNLCAKGMDQNFIEALRRGETSVFIDEAYGPSSFSDQSKKLVDLHWTKADGENVNIHPQKGLSAAFGARAATMETVFFVKMPIAVKGTNTIAELMESSGIAVAVSSDWQTGAISTRPIASSVAETFYGSHTDKIPVVSIDENGFLMEIDLKNGTVLRGSPEDTNADPSSQIPNDIRPS